MDRNLFADIFTMRIKENNFYSLLEDLRINCFVLIYKGLQSENLVDISKTNVNFVFLPERLSFLEYSIRPIFYTYKLHNFGTKQIVIETRDKFKKESFDWKKKSSKRR